MTDESLSDEQLAGWRAAYRQTMAGGSEACPEDETLAAVAAGEEGGEARQHTADHIVSCRRCADRYRTLRELHLEAQGRLGTVPQRSASWQLYGGLAAAALVFLALGITRFLPQVMGTSPGVSPVRGGQHSSVAVEGLSPVDGAVLERPPAELRWPEQTGASGYRVRLFDALAVPLWASDSRDDARIEIPATVAERLEPGSAYFWVVRVLGRSERRELGPFWFEVAE